MAQLMKGETFKDALKLVRGKPRFEYPLYVETKADEIRCRVYREGAHIVRFDSYAEKPLHNMECLQDRFLHFFDQTGWTELDVGILVNGNFNDSYRWVRSANGWPTKKLDKTTGKVSPALCAADVQIILFDLPESTERFEYRLMLRGDARQVLEDLGVPAVQPVGMLCATESEVWAAYEQYREWGYEGAMGKTLNHTYQRRRTFDWMKIKPSEDHDGQITGFNEAVSIEGEPLGRVGSINVTCADGSTAAPSGIPHDLGRELWENQGKYVGQWIEFYCMERDRQGGYRHPIYHRFREDK